MTNGFLALYYESFRWRTVFQKFSFVSSESLVDWECSMCFPDGTLSWASTRGELLPPGPRCLENPSRPLWWWFVEHSAFSST